MTSSFLGCLLALSVGIFVCNRNNYVGASEVHSPMVSVRPTKLWRFLAENEEAILQRYSENIDEFSVGRIKCLRYCIQSKLNGEDPDILHVIWNLDMKNKSEMGSTFITDKGFTPEILQGKSIKSDDPWNVKNQCTFSIVIGCEIPQEVADTLNKVETNYIKSLQINLDVLGSDSSALNFINEKLIDENKSMNESETSFYVQENQAEVNAIVLGDISRIDLKIPIGAFLGTSRTPQLTLATSRMPDGESGVRLNVLNPPPGGWRLGVRGVDSAQRAYRLIVTSAVVPEFSQHTPSLDYFAGDERLSVFQNANDDQFVHKNAGIIPRQIKVAEEKMDQVNDSNGDREISARMISGNQSPDAQIEQKPFKFPLMKNDVEIMNLDANLTIEDRILDREYSETDDLSRSINDELPMKKPLIVDINPNTNLVALPGTIHRLTFDITNNHILSVRHRFMVRSTPFRVRALYPPYGEVVIAPGQTFSVVVEIIIPQNIGETANSVSIRVEGIESIEKTATVYVRPTGSKLSDDTKPTIYYYFNNNCALRTSAEKCLKSFWSVDITIQDAETGLKSVSSSPRGVFPRSQYISGSTSPIYFYYSNNCCNRVIEVTATDVAGNVISKKIDVNVWYNLTEGEIAAVVIGTFFIILLIVLIIITILYCVNRRKSHDLPYSQRYGSRSTPAGNQ